ncbi:hypothetical protein P7H62_06250 [Vagococcus carniphilus]|uniref:hypothetical protein n=1 Tax=Vagococcus carniphilus TaxID=218144 RepID=UPI002890884A|nr:hypothetical protein [Vagococcus carniphilus]MDT2830882.1 hypothetical protein [Vagococcus carniphilus]MDT2854045.1 hypothetical protein [Vagococcus carniphilus]
MIVISWLNYVIPVLSIFITYFLGTLNSKNNLKKDVNLQRYETFYVPYMSKLLAAYNFTDDPHKSPFEVRGVYFDMIMNNMHLLDSSSSKLIPSYYKRFLDLLEFENGNDDFQFAQKRYDEIFIEISTAILKEAEELSKSLNYPNLAKTILTSVDHRTYVR